MDLERCADTELAVHALLLWPEKGRRLRHRDDLGLVNLVRVPTGDEGRRALGEYVLHPVGEIPVGQGDQEAVVVLDGYDGGLVQATRSAPDVPDDRRAGSFLAGRSQRERPGDPG